MLIAHKAFRGDLECTWKGNWVRVGLSDLKAYTAVLRKQLVWKVVICTTNEFDCVERRTYSSTKESDKTALTNKSEKLSKSQRRTCYEEKIIQLEL